MNGELTPELDLSPVTINKMLQENVRMSNELRRLKREVEYHKGDSEHLRRSLMLACSRSVDHEWNEKLKNIVTGCFLGMLVTLVTCAIVVGIK